MQIYETKDIRNIAVLGHGGDGKTTLVEAFLFNAKASERFGKVDAGTTVSDYDEEEKKRKNSINLSVAPIEINGKKINFVDVPGYFDFAGEQNEAIAAVESGIIVLSAVGGLDVGAEKAYDALKKAKKPVAFIVNQMDRENANFNRVLEQLQDKYGTSVVPFQLPIMKGAEFAGVCDIITSKAWSFDGATPEKTTDKNIDVPAEIQAEIDDLRDGMMEAAAETSEELMEKYFEEGELSDEEIHNAMLAGVVQGDIIPVFCCAGLINRGVRQLASSLALLMPSPEANVGYELVDGKKILVGSDDTFRALVFKTIVDPFVGKLSLVKIVTGSISDGGAVYNVNREVNNDRVGHVYVIRGGKQEQVTEMKAGDIGAFAKLTVTQTGDTLTAQGCTDCFKGIEFAESMMALPFACEKEGDEDKVFSGLARIIEEDPTLRIVKNNDTNQTLLYGVGEMHLDVAACKLKNKFKSGIKFIERRVAYRETIRKEIRVQGRHKKQSGGHGQFGDVWIKFEPLMDSAEDFEFVDAIVGGVVPRNFIPAVEKGLRECLPKGVLAGYPMTGLKATLDFGSYHPVDSSEMAFKVAASLAFKQLDTANPVLMEPIVKASVIVPDEYMGDVIGDMNRRRGRVLGMGQCDGGQMVEAEVPESELFKYPTDLRSMTQGRGSYTLEFVRYEDVPSNIAQKAIEQHKKEVEEEAAK